MRSAIEEFPLLGQTQPLCVPIKSATASSRPAPITCEDMADCESPSCSPAWGEIARLASARKTSTLSQSIIAPPGRARSRYRFSDKIMLKHIGRRAALGMGGKEALSLQPSDAASARCGDRLAVDVVGNVAGGEYAGHRRGRRIGGGRAHSPTASSQAHRRPVRSTGYGR